MIDEVRFYNRPLTAGEVIQNLNQPNLITLRPKGNCHPSGEH